MRKIIVFLLLFLSLSSVSFAVLHELKFLTKEEIEQLTNEQLLETFVETQIGKKASETFFGNAGFGPKDYQKFKELLRYVIDLRKEILKRDLEAPPIETWIE